MQLEINTLWSRAWPVFVLCAGLCVACSKGAAKHSVSVPPALDAGMDMDEATDASVTTGCVDVDVTADAAVEHLADFTARFQVGAAYDRTVMLFGGMAVEEPNTPRRAYIFALDKVDAQRMAMKYPDFYLCSSAGGQEASTYIHAYSLVPATCAIHQQLVNAIRVYLANAKRGGDRTSLQLEGAPLTVKSITSDTTGQDVSDQVSDQQFHLITSVKQLTGESVVQFGTTK